jgi:hypothetical protein
MIPTSGKITLSRRKVLEVDGKQKQYSGPEDRGIIPATSSCFPPGRKGIWAEDTGKKRNLNGRHREEKEFERKTPGRKGIWAEDTGKIRKFSGS